MDVRVDQDRLRFADQPGRTQRGLSTRGRRGLSEEPAPAQHVATLRQYSAHFT
jgi:hypothetical protein